MKLIAIGAHLRRDDIEPVAEAIDAGPVFLSAVSVDDDQPLGDRDLLVRIAGIRAQLLDRVTFIAIRYGFSAKSAAEAAAKCAEHAQRWRATLERHRDSVEMTLKLPATTPQARPDRKQYTSGAAYLKALHAATHAASIDDSLRHEIERLIVPLTAQHRWIHRDEKSMELAMLAARDQVAPIYSAGEALRSSGSAFLLSGPWPLEVFADDHE